MTPHKSLNIVLIVAAVWAFLAWPSFAEESTVGLFLFQAADCQACQVVEDEVLPTLKEQYGEWLQVRTFDAAQPKDYAVLLELGQEHGEQIRQLPALLVDGTFLEGEEAVQEQLPGVVEGCVAKGGCPFPSEAQPSRMQELPTMASPPKQLEDMEVATPGVIGYMGTEPECPSCLFGASSVSAAYFYSGADWQAEQWSWFVMRYLLEERMNLYLRTFDVDYPHNEALWWDLCHYYDLSDQCTTPTVFVGAYAFVEGEISASPLIAAWKEYSRELMPSPWQLLEEGQPRPHPQSATMDARRTESQASAIRSGNIVHVAYFHSPTCPHCQAVEEEVLPALQSKYGQQLDITVFNVKEPGDYAALLLLEARYKVHVNEVPVMFIGEVVLEGETAIREGLEAQIEGCLQKGGCPPPTDWEPGEESSVGEKPPATALEEHLGPGVTAYRGTGRNGIGSPLVQVAYFFESGCQVCDRVWYDLRHLLEKYDNLALRVYDIDEPENKLLNEALSQHYGVPEEKHLSTPALFVGDRYFLGDEITLQRVEAAYREYSDSSSAAPWELVAGGIEQARARIVDRFRSFGLYTVVAAGLIDGLNPCAFATIIFFVSYLAISGRKGKEILIVGGAFTLGVFLAYLLVGVGLWKVLQTVDFLAVLGRWVYLATALLCLALAVFSVLDYRKARRGKLEEMTLSLPHSMRMRINRTIRRTRSVRAYVGVAFITGLAVSIIELACTGQVYLPTIIFVMGVPELRVRAFIYLLLYNLMFILPLVVIFVLVFRGTTSKQLTHFLQTRAAAVKLAMSGLFLALAVWLLYAVFGG